MRNPDGTLAGNLDDEFSAKISESLVRYVSSSINENLTTYDLLPVVVNKPPIIKASITETSNPPIKPYATADATGNAMYLYSDGTVKVNLGTSFTFRLEAEQPDVLNVENGIPKILPAKQGLVYVWKKDGKVISSYAIQSLQSELSVNQNELSITNVQPEHAGTYTCEVSNDIGVVISEPIVLEVLNLDFDSYFYKNLVRNPYGSEGVEEWESINTDFTTRQFTKAPTTELTRQNRIDLFGYSVDTLYPRPYQIDTGFIKEFDMTDSFTKNGSYFTREGYEYDLKGGNFFVRAYQDIDVSEIQGLIKGGVYGVEGVRAVFSCYIGNALSYFVPVEEYVNLVDRLSIENYVANRSRISTENFLKAGPATGIFERVYVTVEEFDNETKVFSTLLTPSNEISVRYDKITLFDPWTKGIQKHYGKTYYQDNIFNLPDTPQSLGDSRDAILFTADELLPDQFARFTYGQYAEFNKIIFDRLNPNTTKIRITLNFETLDERLYETVRNIYQRRDRPSEFVGWQKPYKQNSWLGPIPGDSEKFIGTILTNLAKNQGKSSDEFIPSINDPRGMVTALNLTLLPILTQNKQATDFYTNSTLRINDTPISKIQSSVVDNLRIYDPYGVGSRTLRINFELASQPSNIDSSYRLNPSTQLKIKLETVDINNNAQQFPITPESLFPYGIDTRLSAQTLSRPLTKQSSSADQVERDLLKTYVEAQYTTPNGEESNQWSIALSTQQNWIMKTTPNPIVEGNETTITWKNKARYLMYFALPNSQTAEKTTLNSNQYPLQTYYLDLDFSNPNDTKVTLTRDENLYPGKGTITFNLPHSIDPYGTLVCDFTSDVLATPYISGGMGYINETNDYSVTISGKSLIDNVKVLHANIGDYNLTSTLENNVLFSSSYQDIRAGIANDRELLKTVDTAGPVTGSAEEIDLIDFLEALDVFAFNPNATIDLSGNSAYPAINEWYKPTWTIPFGKPESTYFTVGNTPSGLRQTKYPPGIVEAAQTYLLDNRRPSLYGVKPVDPNVFGDGVGSPSYGFSDVGVAYVTQYSSLRDSYINNT